MAAYPWGWTTPSAAEVNGKDTGSYDARSKRLIFQEPNKPWYAVVGASLSPGKGSVSDSFWGPIPQDQRAGYMENGNGTGAELQWNVNLDGASSRTLWIAVGGSHTSLSEAQQAVTSGLSDPAGELDAKVAQRQDLWNRTQVNLPDQQLQAAFDWGKLNMADLRRVVTDAQIRFVDEGKSYPGSTTTVSKLSGFGAGYPDYPWYFGTDGAYTAYPMVASGQWSTIEDHLRTLEQVSRIVNGSTGKLVHEIVTTGDVYFGANSSPGDTNETSEFASAVDLVWRWTGDDAFMSDMYGFVKDGMQYVTSQLDQDHDLWPEGFGMVERGGMGAEKLDVAVYTWRGLLALAGMAQARGDTATATWARNQADAMASHFDADWWMSGLGLYADSLCDSPATPQPGWINYCTSGGNQKLNQRHWIQGTPMETGMAPSTRAAQVLDTMEGPDFTGSCGLYHTGKGGGPDGSGELKCWTLPTAVMGLAEANYGRLGTSQAPFYMDAIAKQLNLEMPGALPEIAPSPDYNPFVDFRERAMFMQAWSSYGVQWPVVNDFLGIRPDVPNGSLYVVPQVPPSWPGLSVSNMRIGNGTMSASASRSGTGKGAKYQTNVSAPGGLDLTIGYVIPVGATVTSVTLDGSPVSYSTATTIRGQEVRVSTTTNSPHTLVVKTK